MDGDLSLISKDRKETVKVNSSSFTVQHSAFSVSSGGII